MNIFERLAQHFGYTFNLYIAVGKDLKYINILAIFYGVIAIAAFVGFIAAVICIIKNVKNK